MTMGGGGGKIDKGFKGASKKEGENCFKQTLKKKKP